MPIQSPAWNDFLSCPVCCLQFDGNARPPVSLGCGHTLCSTCLHKLHTNHCPFDQTEMNVKFSELPINRAILSLMSDNGRRGDHHRGGVLGPPPNLSCSSPSSPPPSGQVPPSVPLVHASHYLAASETICRIALFLRPCAGASNLNLSSGGSGGALSRSMQRKLVTLINCQLLESEGRARAIRAARSLGERTVTELILHHQNHHQLSATLWAAVRSRGCQFLGPAMQEEVIRLVLLALEDGSALSRKVLVMFVVQRLEPHFPQASKTSIGHVVQLLYRASCFKVSKRERDSSLMQLKEEFRCYDSLRREHDTQIVQIATEAGLRIAPDQWSSLLYGDVAHKSHMQSIMDKLQTPDSFAQSVNELLFVLHRIGDPGDLTELWPQLEMLAKLDPGGGATLSSTGETNPLESAVTEPPTCIDSNSNSDEESYKTCAEALSAVHAVLAGLVHFLQHFGHRRLQDHHYHAFSKYRPTGSVGRVRHNAVPLPQNTPLKRFEEETRARNRYTNSAAANNNHHNFGKEQRHENASVSENSPKAALDYHEKPSPLADHNTSHYEHPSVKASCNFNAMNGAPKVANVHNIQPTLHQHSNSSARNDGLQTNTNNKDQSCMNSLINQPSIKMFDTPKVVGMPHQTQQPPYLSFPSTPPNLVRVPTGPTQSPFLHPAGGPALYANTAAMPPDFGAAYSAFGQQPPMFSNPPNMATTPVYPQAATPILTAEIYPSNPGTPQTVLVNPMTPMNHHVNAVPPQGQIYNVISPSTLEILYPVHKGSNGMQSSQQMLQPLPQHMPQPMMPQGAMLGSWYEFPSPPGLVTGPPAPSASTQSTLDEIVSGAEGTSNVTTTSSTASTAAASIEPTVLKKKSLSELQELKENIVTRLQTIVGKKETEEVEEHIAKNQEHIACVIPQTLGSTGSSTPAFTATYSIWTSGANFYSIARSCIAKDKSVSLATADCQTNAVNSCQLTEETISSPSNSCNSSINSISSTTVTGVSQFGPISKRQMSRTSSTSSSSTAPPIQVSASNNVNSTTTSTIGTNYPLLSLSPMPHQAVLFPSPGAGTGLGYPAFGVGMYHHPVGAPCLEAMPPATLNTIHHGIIDPPHLHMSQLDPTGSRPSDPLDNSFRHNGIAGSKEERQRQQLNAVTECIDPFNSVKDMPEERRLKQELSFVMHGIQEKLNVRHQSDDDTDQQHHEAWLQHSSSDFELQQTWQ